MAQPAPPSAEREIPFLQRLFENIWFLLLIGVILPTVVYTGWSLVDLAILPHFDSAGEVHGSTHSQVGADEPSPAARTEPAATTAESGSAQGAATAEAGASHDATSAAVGEEVVVSMKNMAFATKALEVAAGTTVTWRNDDPFAHSVAYGTPQTPAEELLFEASGDYGQGGAFSYTFEQPGVHDIYCDTPGHYAAGMTMVVAVVEERQ